MNYYEISQKLKELLQPMYEMARINGTIEVNNEDVVDKDGNVNEKFAHFHWMYKKKIHFKFSNRIPKNITELRKLVKEKDSEKKISDSDLKDCLKDLRAVYNLKGRGIMTVFEASKQVWSDLHPQRDLSSELIIL